MPNKVEVYVGREWVGNALIFPTHKEADSYGKALSQAWILVNDYQVLETKEPANYRFIGPTNHDLEPIGE